MACDAFEKPSLIYFTGASFRPRFQSIRDYVRFLIERIMLYSIEIVLVKYT